MVNVDTEVNKYKYCKDRDELGRRIKEYMDLALQNAGNITIAAQYNMVAFKLQKIYDQLPAPHFKKTASIPQNQSVKTATITNEENTKISAAWEQKAGARKGVKR